MTGFRPALRQGLRVQAAASGLLLHDDPAGVALPLPAGLEPLLPLLEAGELSEAEAIQVSGVGPEPARVFLRSLALTGLLAGADEAGRRLALAARAAGPRHAVGAPIRLLLDSACSPGAGGLTPAGGDCCRNGAWISLSQVEVERLEELALPDLSEPARVAWRTSGRPDGLAARRAGLARREDGVCVFLGEAGCRVAEAAGPEARPLACRLDPLVVQRTPAALVLSDQTCAAPEPGEPLYQRFEPLQPLVREAGRRASLDDGVTNLPSGLRLRWSQVRQLLEQVLQLLPPELDPAWPAGAETPLLLVGQVLRDFERRALAAELGAELAQRLLNEPLPELAPPELPACPPGAWAAGLRQLGLNALPDPGQALPQPELYRLERQRLFGLANRNPALVQSLSLERFLLRVHQADPSEVRRLANWSGALEPDTAAAVLGWQGRWPASGASSTVEA